MQPRPCRNQQPLAAEIALFHDRPSCVGNAIRLRFIAAGCATVLTGNPMKCRRNVGMVADTSHCYKLLILKGVGDTDEDSVEVSEGKQISNTASIDRCGLHFRKSLWL